MSMHTKTDVTKASKIITKRDSSNLIDTQ